MSVMKALSVRELRAKLKTSRETINEKDRELYRLGQENQQLREQNQQLREQLEISQGRQSVLFRALNQALSAVEESPYCTSPVSYRKPVKL